MEPKSPLLVACAGPQILVQISVRSKNTYSKLKWKLDKQEVSEEDNLVIFRQVVIRQRRISGWVEIIIESTVSRFTTFSPSMVVGLLR